MKKYTKLFISLLSTATILLTAVFTPISFAAEKESMAVLDFRNSTRAYWWRTGVGRDLAGMLTNELASSRKFRMVERQKLSAVLSEQNLAASGRVSASTGAKIGKMVGAKYLVTATVSAYEEDVSETGGGISYKGFSVGGKREKAYMAVDLRVIDSTTGEIVDTRTVEARTKGGGLKLGIHRNGFGGALKNENKTPAGKAIRAMVAEISDYLVCSMVKQNRCLEEYDAKEEKRRDSLKGAIELD